VVSPPPPSKRSSRGRRARRLKSGLAATLSLFELALGKEVGKVIRAYVEPKLKAQGVPLGVFIVPDHLRDFAGTYSDEEMWPYLIGIQHDEKDVHRVIGPAGIQDWGDGEAQAILEAHSTAINAIDRQVAELRGLAAAAAAPQQQYDGTVGVLTTVSASLASMLDIVKQRAAAMDAKQTKLCTKRDALAAGRIADHECYTKHITFLADRIRDAQAFTTQVTTHRAAVDALPQAQSATQTASHMILLLEEARVLLEKAFGFANVAASKVRRSACGEGWV